jgi:Ca-activated chloride channel family protein
MPVETNDRTTDNARTSFTLSYDRTPSLGMPYSPTHSLEMSDEGRTRRIDVRGDARDVTLLFPLPRADAPAISTLAYAPGGEDGFALITLSPPSDRSRQATPRDVTFVLDVSGSMAGRKMEQARAAGRQLLSTLREGDRFRIIDFSSDVRSFRDDFVYATSNNIRDANRYLDALEAVGSTNISGALAEALRPARRDRERYYPIDRADNSDGESPRVDPRRLPVVLFVTDGEPTVGERNPEAIAQMASRDRGDARVFTFGLGSDVNVALLERLAMEGRGTAQFVRPDESVERMVGVVASRLVDPVLTDVRVRTEGDVRLNKMLPGQAIDLFAGQDLVLLARYSGDGDARLVFEGRRGNQTVRWTSRVDFPDRERANPFVARLWATQRVGYLAAEKRRNGGSKELDDEIRSLGERFGIPTEFTSYLVQEPQTVAAFAPSNGGVAGGVSRRPVAAPAPTTADRNFAAAKAAAEQRAATSVAAVDMMQKREMTSDEAARTRRVDSRTLELRGEVWTDVRYRDGTRTLHVLPYSHAYFELLDKLPDLRAVFALGDKVVVMGRVAAIQLDAKAAEPSASDVAWAIANW